VREVEVLISYEVVKLFSEQLYTTPVKAVEELVVNSWDADARNCSVLVDIAGSHPVVAVFDDGKGMDVDELEDLWHIGVSSKTSAARLNRRQIGKFGIGKLASYSVARRATYVSKVRGSINSVVIDFEDFARATSAMGIASPVSLRIRELKDANSLIDELRNNDFARVLELVNAASGPEQSTEVSLDKLESWTLVVLEDLKPKVAQLRSSGRLRWVLETAMPFASDFTLSLNNELIQSSKQRLDKVAEVDLRDLSDRRLTDLERETGEKWERTATGLRSINYPNGVTGEAYVTDRSLYAEGGKSEDLGRSHGFFVRVHNRLINETDPLFGASPLSFTTFYRFAAVINADDLNPFITAARDDVEQSEMKGKLRALLISLFYQAREQASEAEATRLKKERINKEGKLDYVSTNLVERPLADAMAEAADQSLVLGEVPDSDPSVKAEHSSEWIYLEKVADVASIQKLIEQLYIEKRVDRGYLFRYTATGRLSPLVQLNAADGVFSINEDHEFAIEFGQEGQSRRALEAVVAAEAMLEVYLRETRTSPEVVRHVLNRRDMLLRGLARDHGISLESLARDLRDASDDAHGLEIALVGALRALGFGAQHIGGPGTPDGLANYVLHGVTDNSFTLEAKSSRTQPELSQLDFAGLRSHYQHSGAQGAMVVAPTYPGGLAGESEVSRRARLEKVSCWTIDQLAQVVLAAEARHINASHIEDIVLSKFDPQSVTQAITHLLKDPTYSRRDLYVAILKALNTLTTRLRGAPRDISMIATAITYDSPLDFADLDREEVARALDELARASRGMLHVSEDERVQVLGHLDELARRVSALTGSDTPVRRKGSFWSTTSSRDSAG